MHLQCEVIVLGMRQRDGRGAVTHAETDFQDLRRRASEGLIQIERLRGVGDAEMRQQNFHRALLRGRDTTLAAEGKPLRVVNDQVLTPTSTRDLAEKLLPLVRTRRYGLYHMTNTGECSWYEFAQEIFQRASLAAELEPVSTAAFAAR